MYQRYFKLDGVKNPPSCGDKEYVFVWGKKPRNPKAVSEDATEILPFADSQSGSKWSMYD